MEKQRTISKATLIKRVNRVLVKRDEVLRALRGQRHRHELGEYYIIDLNTNFVITKDVDLLETAKELGAIKDWEGIQD